MQGIGRRIDELNIALVGAGDRDGRVKDLGEALEEISARTGAENSDVIEPRVASRSAASCRSSSCRTRVFFAFEALPPLRGVMRHPRQDLTYGKYHARAFVSWPPEQ